MDVADPIPPSVKALAELFKNELAAVTFPGVDGAILEQLIADVQAQTEAVTKAEAALEAARTALRETEETLAIKSQKALAYAKVYAEDRPEIASKVDLVARIAGTPTMSSSSSREPGSDAPKRRGRPKTKAVAAEGMDATPAPPAAETTDMTPAVPTVIELGASEVVADAASAESPAMPD